MSDGNFHSLTVGLICRRQIYARLRTSDPTQLYIICKCFLPSAYGLIPLQTALAYFNQHKALVGIEGEQNGADDCSERGCEGGSLHPVASAQTICTVLCISVPLKCVVSMVFVLLISIR
jgi:hypothetical protein